jgi:hypothetical protein
MRMPEPDASVIARRAEIAENLRRIVPGEGVIVAEAERRAYESDGLTAYRQSPMIVVLPETTDQVSRILRYCQAEGVKIVPRGAGTSLSGGALPLADGVLLGLGKFNRILDIDFANRLHDRRQCRRELGRRALPEIRAHHQQRARRRDGADERRGHPAGRQAARRRRL